MTDARRDPHEPPAAGEPLVPTDGAPGEAALAASAYFYVASPVSVLGTMALWWWASDRPGVQLHAKAALGQAGGFLVGLLTALILTPVVGVAGLLPARPAPSLAPWIVGVAWVLTASLRGVQAARGDAPKGAAGRFARGESFTRLAVIGGAIGLAATAVDVGVAWLGAPAAWWIPATPSLLVGPACLCAVGANLARTGVGAGARGAGMPFLLGGLAAGTLGSTWSMHFMIGGAAVGGAFRSLLALYQAMTLVLFGVGCALGWLGVRLLGGGLIAGDPPAAPLRKALLGGVLAIAIISTVYVLGSVLFSRGW